MQSQPQSVRRFTLADGLILIGAIGVTLALVRGWSGPMWITIPPHRQSNLSKSQQPWSILPALRVTKSAIGWSIPFALMATIAVVVLRLRSPGPTGRRLARQPGIVGCVTALAVSFSLPVRALVHLTVYYLTQQNAVVRLPSPPFNRFNATEPHPFSFQRFRFSLLGQFPDYVSLNVALTVVVAWGVLKATGAWRPERGWIDRAGRCLSIYWILQGIAVWLLTDLWGLLI